MYVLKQTVDRENQHLTRGEKTVIHLSLSYFLVTRAQYNFIITARILLSWFPQAQGVAALQPVYAVTDPYLNLFRGLIPPLFGLDFSPILAFFLLSALTNATAAVGCEIPPQMRQQQAAPNNLPKLVSRTMDNFRRRRLALDESQPCMNY